MPENENQPKRCAIYVRKSTEQGLEQEYNSLDAQRDAATAYIKSQESNGWVVTKEYRDGGFSGGNTNRPALQEMLQDIKAGKIDLVVVYKIDRLSRHSPTSPSCTPSSRPTAQASFPSHSSSTPRTPRGE